MATANQPQEDKHLGWWLLGGALLGLGALTLYFRREVAEAAGDVSARVMNLFKSKADFIHRLFDALSVVANTANPAIGTAQKTILVAQAIHESEWGVASASRNGFNYWNLTAGPPGNWPGNWKGPVIEGADTEYDAAGHVKNIVQSFRRYSSDDEAMRDMLAFIGPRTRYAKAWDALMKGDAEGYITALHDAGFYTQPVNLYWPAVRAAMQTVVQELG